MKAVNKISIIVLILFFIISFFYKYGGYDFTKYQFLHIDSAVPKEFYICFDTLNKMSNKEDIEEFKKTKESELSKYHFGIGLYIRNNWIRHDELNINLEKVCTNLGIKSIDDMSGIIIVSFHRYLNNENIRLKEQIENRNNINNEESDMIYFLQSILIIQLVISVFLIIIQKHIKQSSHFILLLLTHFLSILSVIGFFADSTGILNGFAVLFDFLILLFIIIYKIKYQITQWKQKKMLIGVFPSKGDEK